MSLTIESAADTLIAGHTLGPERLELQLGDCHLSLASNSPELVTGLRDYFAHVPAPDAASRPDLELIAIESAPPEPPGWNFVDWKREPGKTGRKDAYLDLPNGRLVKKVRTGMVFLQSETRRIAAGPCREYDNQVINFINAQYMNWLQHRGWLICHAAGLVRNGRGLGIAGFSGGGKSTLMLHLLEHRDIAYLTNDRLFVRQEQGQAQALGIPKLPRINPGTIVHNASLEGMIPAAERARLLALPPAELWEIEDKYDVHVEQVYGPGRIQPAAPLDAFLVLNWKRGNPEPPSLEPVDLAQRRDLLGALMKSPGPFYQYPDGSFHGDDAEFDEAAYLRALAGVTVWEARGGIDFAALEQQCLERILAD